ncbi:MAG TPA: hypothetical protein VM534_10230 [Thermoanaerobaculia bacterium]|nr:hypothetical protein [Thermoanaerobaculia bacterium]
MKRLSAIALLLLLATAAEAQTFFGGRYSNYNSEVTVAGFPIETGRQSSLGLVLDLRSGRFVLRGQLDHDFEEGISPIDFLPIDFAEYSRDRIEIVAGYAPAEMFDLEAGFRLDSFELNGLDFFGTELFGSVGVDYQAIVFGAHFHAPPDADFQWYVSGRGYIGSFDTDDLGFSASQDATGWKAEAGVPIRVGDSRWRITPGFELEAINAENNLLEISSNRLFLNFAYEFGR